MTNTASIDERFWRNVEKIFEENTGAPDEARVRRRLKRLGCDDDAINELIVASPEAFPAAITKATPEDRS